MNDRAEAAQQAMAWARKAQRYDDARQEAAEAWDRDATNPEAGPGLGARLQAHEAMIARSSKSRDRAITMATMWSTVAAIQENQ